MTFEELYRRTAYVCSDTSDTGLTLARISVNMAYSHLVSQCHIDNLLETSISSSIVPTADQDYITVPSDVTEIVDVWYVHEETPYKLTEVRNWATMLQCKGDHSISPPCRFFYDYKERRIVFDSEITQSFIDAYTDIKYSSYRSDVSELSVDSDEPVIKDILHGTLLTASISAMRFMQQEIDDHQYQAALSRAEDSINSYYNSNRDKEFYFDNIYRI